MAEGQGQNGSTGLRAQAAEPDQPRSGAWHGSSLNTNFPICKMGIMIPTSLACRALFNVWNIFMMTKSSYDDHDKKKNTKWGHLQACFKPSLVKPYVRYSNKAHMTN